MVPDHRTACLASRPGRRYPQSKGRRASVGLEAPDRVQPSPKRRKDGVIIEVGKDAFAQIFADGFFVGALGAQARKPKQNKAGLRV